MVALAGLVLGAPLAAVRADEEAAAPPVIAVADFDYADTSGEVRDQQADHAVRLVTLASTLRADLGRSATYRVVALPCEAGHCSADTLDPDALLAAARQAGARLVVYGGIHKQSTLVQWMKVEVVELSTDRLVFDKLYTFRGDTDTAWQRAEQFLAGDIESAALGR
jgi:hypothetical protein